jgi:hypothetical protein
VAGWASTHPLASVAVTAHQGPPVFTVIIVSKPARFTLDCSRQCGLSRLVHSGG